MEKDMLPAARTLLETIRESAERFAEVIAKTLDADVLIVDSNLNIVGKTALYFRLYSLIDINSIIGQVLLGQKAVVVEDRKLFETCKRCPAYEECQISAMIGVPVYYMERAVGVIALILPKHRMPEIFEKKDFTVAFLKNMAELLTGNLKFNDEYVSARQVSLEREQMLNCLDEGIVYTDNAGEILYYNQAFAEMFGIHEGCRGENLLYLLPHRILRDYFQNRMVLRNLKISMEHGTNQFYGFLSAREISVYGDTKRQLFSFRSISNIWADASAAGYGSMVTLEWCRGWLLEDSLIDKAKDMAVTDMPVLIQGPASSLNEIAAKAVCNYSDRSASGIVNVYCNNVYRELFEQFLFSRFGEIQRANHATLLFHDVENLPIYLQKRLLEFMKTREMVLSNSEVIKSDARLIFTTTANLKTLSEQGGFLEELYIRIGKNALLLSPIKSDKSRLAAMLDSGMEFYKAKHEKPSVYLNKDAKFSLLNRNWGENPNEIDKILEQIVTSRDGMVSDKDLEAMGIYRSGNEGVSAISDMEREKIQRLLDAGYSKVEIARMLGIGRATLYRKMAEYHLNGNNK